MSEVIVQRQKQREQDHANVSVVTEAVSYYREGPTTVRTD